MSNPPVLQVCEKRTALGACVETSARTTENDNDMASKYFETLTNQDQPDDGKGSATASATTQEQEQNGNELIEKLRQQTEENREQNEVLVRKKTLENNMASFVSPWDRPKVVITNEDGKDVTILDKAQAARLRKAGFIDKRRNFIKQPTEQDLEKAMRDDDFLASLVRRFLLGDEDADIAEWDETVE